MSTKKTPESPRGALPTATPEQSLQTMDLTTPKSDAMVSPSGVTIDLPTGHTPAQSPAESIPSFHPGATTDFSPPNPTVAETMGVGAVGTKQQQNTSSGKAVPFLRGYEILGELGRGGMGIVYKARQTQLNRLVAVKMVLAGGHAGPEQLARFQTEAQAVALLQHPNIVQIYEVGECDRLPYFTLEFIDGGALDKALAGKPQIPEEAARLMETLARAMHFAHKHGVVHRDLKPANVLLTTDGEPKITDFGLAKKLEGDSSQTKSGTLMGTPSYMAPELPRDIETICLKCLQKEPSKRYADGDALAEDLRRYCDGEPIQARPVSAPERLWRWCRRNPRMAGLTAAVAVLLVTAGTALAISSGQMAREREMVNLARVEAQGRLDRGKQEVARGNFGKAQDLLGYSVPLVETAPQLADVRNELHLLRDQVALYREFKELLDAARYFGLFGPKSTLTESRVYCQKVIELYDQIEKQTGKASCGMPPLVPAQQQLLREDYFEAFLVSAQVEWESVAHGSDAAAQKAAVTKAVEWLDRAEKIDPSTWILHYRRAALLAKLGDSKRAQADAEAAAKLRPTSPLDRFWFGLAQHMEADSIKDKDSAKAELRYKQAIQEYAAVVRSRPDHFWAYFDGASCHYQLGSLPEATIGYSTCIQIRPEVPWPYYNRGAILAQQQQFEAAVEDLTHTLEQTPNFADALDSRGMAWTGLDKTDQALADFAKALKIDPKLTSVYLHRAETYRKLNRQAEAFADFEQAVQIDPKNPLVYSVRAAVYMGLFDYAKAREDYVRLIQLQPTQVQNYRMHGVASLRLHDLPAAHGDWAMLAKLLPGSEEPKYNSAITFKAQRKYDEAIKSLGEAILIKPNDSKAYLLRAQINHQLGNFNDALADQALVLTKLKDVKGEILNDYGDLLRTMGRFPEATAAYQQSIKLLPKQTDAYVGIALVHLLQNKPSEAEPVFAQLLAANPDSFRAYLRRAEFERNRSNWAAAVKDCEQATRLDPKSSLPLLLKASIRAAQGEFREGAADAEKILQARHDGHVNQAAACVFSLASQSAKAAGEEGLANQYADRAAALLTDALETGFLDLNFQAVNRMLVDPALAPVRQHPQVLELLPVLKKPGA